ncbi:MAG: hypothetical protein WAJ85_11315 [Candidatus Baltobacteraceae bacterium]|jgi:hypothetical protein
MKKIILAPALAAAIAAGPLAGPALADGGASTHNILILGAGAAAAIGLTNYNHKKHAKAQEQQESTRRQAAYKAYFYHQNGYYPTTQEVHDWYLKTYGSEPT